MECGRLPGHVAINRIEELLGGVGDVEHVSGGGGGEIQRIKSTGIAVNARKRVVDERRRAEITKTGFEAALCAKKAKTNFQPLARRVGRHTELKAVAQTGHEDSCGSIRGQDGSAVSPGKADGVISIATGTAGTYDAHIVDLRSSQFVIETVETEQTPMAPL